MGFRSWLSGHRSLAVTTTSATLVAALVATLAITSGGYTAQRTDLNDASVWVANGDQSFVGRANTAVLELDTVVASEGNDLDLVQEGSTILLVDRSDATLDIIDPATSEVVESVPLPPNQPDVFLAGGNVVIYSQGTGELWILPRADLASFDAEREPALNLGADTVVSVNSAGMLFGFSSTAGKVYRVDASQTQTLDETSETVLKTAAGQSSITSVGSTWAVLDATTRRLDLGGRLVSLDALVDGGSGLVLQEPAVTGDSVLVGFSGGVIRVALDSGEAQLAVDSGGGTAAAPVVVGGCAYAAWSGGSAWRDCSDAVPGGSLLSLESVAPGAALSFQVNQSRVVLNDRSSGESWAVSDDGQLIDNWDDLIAVEEDQEEVEENDENTPPETEKNQLPPVAVDDEFGARPGRTSLLPVLLNDYDPNGDVVVVSTVSSIDPAVGRIDVIDSNQQLQLTLAADARGTIAFTYSITDGRGGTATANVSVDVRSTGENAAPKQVRTTRTVVEAGGRVTTSVLGDWVDPDGDPFYLAAATGGGGDVVSHKPEGTVIFTESGAGGGTRSVALIVSDGVANGTGILAITVRDRGAVPIVADPFVVLAYAGQELTIAPLDHVRGGSGPVRLNAVQSQPGVTITPSYETGSFRFESDQVRTYYLEYVVTDDETTATGLVRVDVSAPPGTNTAPITIPKTVFVTSLSSRIVDVAATDIDPSGGVLLVTGVLDLPAGAGVRAEVLEQRSVRVSLTRPLAGSVVFGYRVSNGLADAEGTITVIEIARPDKLQPPIARDDTATVRVGDAITIDVMANDEHPDGESIRLDPVLVGELGDDSGLLFASGNSLRYLAPDHTGDFTAQYQILGPLGQTAQAQVRIEVREPNLETNHPPVPATVTARVLAGERVQIDVPLDGIDPDGDSVQLLGQETNPEKGGVIRVESGVIVYEAGNYSAGTDTFTYTVMDALGARATGTVRVGISPRLDGARNPVAIEDEVRVRPGSTVSVQVLLNDSDPDGSPLSVVSVEPNTDDTTATIIDGTIVDVVSPETEGEYGLQYTIQNSLGGTSSAFIRVIVDEDAPLSYPVARDAVLTLSDVLDRDTIDVDVLQNVFFADGDSRDLGLSVLSGYGQSAEVLGDKKIRVTIGDTRQIIPFAVAHPDDPSIRSYAFIWVPGFNDALPQLDRRAGSIVVNSEESVDIDLNDYVIAVGGRKVRLTDSSTVRATHADGSSLVVDADTLRFTSADLYFGQASISFEVTDGTSASDPEGRKANLVLPIRVEARDNQPPEFNGALIDFEPGQQKVLDLTELTNYAADDLDELVYTVLDPAPVGFTWDLEGQLLSIRANEEAVKGSSSAISLGVQDAVTAGKAGRIELRVVPSTRPLASLVPDNAITRRGQTTVIDVLANDEATNPFPGRPLRVVDVAGIEGSSLPPGISVSASADKRRVTITISDAAEPIDTSFQYQVADATRDPDRYVWGTVTISVQDVPDAPVRPTRQADVFVGGELKLRITPPQPNNAPVTSYRVVSTSQGSYSHDCGTTLICSLTGLTVGAEYRFSVIATNAIGDSAPSPLSDAYTVDYRPAAPATVTAQSSAASDAPNGGSITVDWSDVPDPALGTPVVGYTVEIKGPGVTYSSTATSPFVTTAGGQLSNNTSYTVSVYARNSAQVLSVSDWRRTTRTVTTIGPPIPGSPAPQAAINSANSNGEIRVTWSASDPNGAGTVSYTVGRATGTIATPSCTSGPDKPHESNGSGPGAVTSGWIDTNTEDGATYTYIVYADNGTYCTASTTGPTESKRPPGAASGSATVAWSGDGQYDIRAGNAFQASGIVAKYQFQLDGSGAWSDVSGGQWLTSLGDASHYAVSTTVAYRACRDQTENYCGPSEVAATLIPVNTRASVASCVVGIPPVAQEPINAGPASYGYRFSYRFDLIVQVWSPFTYQSSDNVPSGATAARAEAAVTVNGNTYVDQNPEAGEARQCG
ncbi:tandem-95 repeat protein [Glaciihabitans arcticus]|uniref:Tandem-95 repeat protein n=1 Tax=Glaciihabitans arcticus TaxID=2668039 RepID=A0A4Q9GT96_9MICO|nr:Ig-like domain-containing protein [Glaciihabitans arcticus]TBN56337.1 tandem-95 repeat protein [Glaciihabitans arcticus]